MDYEQINITIRKIANGFIGSVSVQTDNYEYSRTPETYFETLGSALAGTQSLAADPTSIIAAHPVSHDDQPF